MKKIIEKNDAVKTESFLSHVFLICLYLTLSLSCDLLAFRLVKVGGFVVGGGIFIYPALYTLLDLLARINKEKTVLLLIFVLHFFDLLFSYLLYLVNLLPAPAGFVHLHAFNVVISPIPRLFWSGLVGSLFANVFEVLVFSALQKKSSSFMVSSLFSTLLVVILHDVPTDLIAYSKIFPEKFLWLTINNLIIVSMFVMIYTAFASFCLFLTNKGCKF